jgi:hypothetical protein
VPTLRESAIPTEAALLADVPVEVLTVQLAEAGQQGALVVRNLGAERLVTLKTVFTFTHVDGTEQKYVFDADSWDRDEGFVGPGEQISLPLGLTLRPGAVVTKITVTPGYAEFEDGSVRGPDAAQTRKCLQKNRLAKLQELRTFAASFRARPTELPKLLTDYPDLAWIGLEARRAGPEPVLTRLATPRKLAP